MVKFLISFFFLSFFVDRNFSFCQFSDIVRLFVCWFNVVHCSVAYSQFQHTAVWLFKLRHCLVPSPGCERSRVGACSIKLLLSGLPFIFRKEFSCSCILSALR